MYYYYFNFMLPNAKCSLNTIPPIQPLARNLFEIPTQVKINFFFVKFPLNLQSRNSTENPPEE